MTGPLHPVAGIPDDVPDLTRFAGTVAAHINGGVLAQAADHDQAPVFISRAPGRLDVMGGIADYSGALVLQWPIREATRVALRPWRERRIVIVSNGPQGHTRRCEVPLALVADGERPYDEVRAWFAADPTRHWAAYVAGVFHVLAREHAVRFDHGEGNSDAHLLSMLIGCSLTWPYRHCQLILGTWQGVYFVELDGPRERRVSVYV